MDKVQHFLNLRVQVRQVRNIVPMIFAVADKGFIATGQEVKEHEWINTALSTNDPNYITYYMYFDELWNKGCDLL
jgi:hypothetical protein